MEHASASVKEQSSDSGAHTRSPICDDVVGEHALTSGSDGLSLEMRAEMRTKMEPTPRDDGASMSSAESCPDGASSWNEQRPSHPYGSTTPSTPSPPCAVRGPSHDAHDAHEAKDAHEELHGGIARCQSSEASGLTVASVLARLAECDMILELSDLTYVGSAQQSSAGAGACASVLGQGSMGVLFDATLRRGGTQRAVAVKHVKVAGTTSGVKPSCSSPEILRDALWSMLMGAKIKPHPNIVEFLGAVMHNTHGPILVYERVEGMNLDEFYSRQQANTGKNWRPKVHVALDWGRQVFAALEWLHRGGDAIILHRDVKPSNLMLCGASMQHIKMIDFGLARQIPRPCNDSAAGAGRQWGAQEPDETGTSGSTRAPAGAGDGHAHRPAGTDLTCKTGTYRYMAPEVFLHGGEDAEGRGGGGEREGGGGGGGGYGPAADVYSATMSLHFIITGQVAFERMPPDKIAYFAAMHNARPQLELIHHRLYRYGNLADDLVELIAAGWAAAAADRPTARVMMEDLQVISLSFSLSLSL